jgi:hypothetical protein
MAEIRCLHRVYSTGSHPHCLECGWDKVTIEALAQKKPVRLIPYKIYYNGQLALTVFESPMTPREEFLKKIVIAY